MAPSSGTILGNKLIHFRTVKFYQTGPSSFKAAPICLALTQTATDWFFAAAAVVMVTGVAKCCGPTGFEAKQTRNIFNEYLVAWALPWTSKGRFSSRVAAQQSPIDSTARDSALLPPLMFDLSTTVKCSLLGFWIIEVPDYSVSSCLAQSRPTHNPEREKHLEEAGFIPGSPSPFHHLHFANRAFTLHAQLVIGSKKGSKVSLLKSPTEKLQLNHVFFFFSTAHTRTGWVRSTILSSALSTV